MSLVFILQLSLFKCFFQLTMATNFISLSLEADKPFLLATITNSRINTVLSPKVLHSVKGIQERYKFSQHGYYEWILKCDAVGLICLIFFGDGHSPQVLSIYILMHEDTQLIMPLFSSGLPCLGRGFHGEQHWMLFYSGLWCQLLLSWFCFCEQVAPISRASVAGGLSGPTDVYK